MKTHSIGACAEKTEKSEKNRDITGKNASDTGGRVYALEGGNGNPEGLPTLPPAAWMTPELMEKTQAVWSKRYGRTLEQSEVIEILLNVRWFGELLQRGIEGGIL